MPLDPAAFQVPDRPVCPGCHAPLPGPCHCATLGDIMQQVANEASRGLDEGNLREALITIKFLALDTLKKNES